MRSDFEGLELELDSLVCQQTVAKLPELIGYLKVEETIVGKSRMQLVKIIRNAIDKIVGKPGEIDLDVYLRDAIAFVTKTAPPLEKTEEETNLTQLEIKLLALKLAQKQDLESVLKEAEKLRLNRGKRLFRWIIMMLIFKRKL